MKKIILFNITEDWFFCSHFLERALAAQKKGYSIVVISKENNHKKLIENYGISFYPVAYNRKSINPIYELYILFRIIKLYKKIKPDIVHHVAAKPIIYGSIAAKLNKIKSVLNAPVGLGFVFSSETIKARALRPILKFLLKSFINSHRGKNMRNKVVFENYDDLNYFIEIGAVIPKYGCVIRGAGVKVDKIFHSKNYRKVPTITLVARMLKDKGIYEFVSAARKLKAHKVNAKFLLVGDTDPYNPSSLKKSTLKEWDDEKIINWMGWINNIESVLKETDILCLPSYREGLPKSLIEGAAFGLPIITTNTVGCRDVVEDGVNGYLVPIKNIDKLASKLSKLIKSRNLREKMGKESHKIALSKFSSTIINSETLKLYDELFFEIHH